MKTNNSTTQQAPRSFLKALPAAAALFAALVAVPAAAQAAQVWTAPGSQKIRPQTTAPQGAPSGYSLAAAKNEFESFQVVVTGPASNVSMSLSSLSDGQGHSISARDLTLYREELLNVTQPSGGDGASGQWPDALVPDVDPIAGEKRNAFPFSVAAGESRAVLVDVHVPADAPAGTYTGTLRVTGDAQAQVAVTLTVWDFTVPSTSTLRSAFGLAWNGPCMGHGDAGCSNWEAEQQLRMRYVQAALDNHVSIDVPYITAPVSADGATQNWADYDAHVAPFLNGTANTRLAGAKLTAVEIEAAAGYGNQAQTAAWSKHFRQNGWIGSLFNYVCDEPPLTCAWSDIPGRIAGSKAADAQIPTVVTTTATQASQNGVNGIDIFSPVVNFMDDKSQGGTYPGDQRGTYGGNVWWYQSCMSFGCAGVGGAYSAGTALYETGWPTLAVDSDATRNRAEEWLSFTYGISGEIYYETTTAYFHGDPWTNQFAFGGTGDGTLFYPGTPAKIGGQTEIPVESLRLKQIRDGMEDYELLHLAASLGQGDQAKAIAQSVFAKTYQAQATPAALDAARAQLAALILKASGKGGSNGVVAGAGPTGGNAPAIPVAAAGLGGAGHGGCSTGGSQGAFWALPLFALLWVNRRRQVTVAR